MSGSGRFARVYFDQMATDCPSVLADAVLLGSWVQLLIKAEQSWPAPADLPRSIPDDVVKTLFTLNLISFDGTDGFRIRGMNAERTRRADAGRSAAQSRWEMRSASGTPMRAASGTPMRSASGTKMPSSKPKPKPSNKTFTPPPSPSAEGAMKTPRENGTNARANGTNPRANGTSPRQEREGRKRQPVSIASILAGEGDGT